MFNRYIETKEFLRLPLSGNCYFISINGKVKDKNGNYLPEFTNEFSEKVVKINWLKGKEWYKVAELVAFTFKPLKLHFKFWGELRILYKDLDRNNIHPSNLVWKFPKGFGSKDYNGFAFIPMFSRYGINKEGIVYDYVLNKTLKCYYNKGYYSYSLIPDIGPRTSLKRHKGLCLAFTDYPHNVDDLQVNHIDKIPGNDWIENLEWVTPSRNRIHALENGVKAFKKTPILVRDLITYEIKEYDSIRSCSKDLFISIDIINWRINTPTNYLYKDNLQFKRKTDEKDWYNPKNLKQELLEFSWEKAVLVKNVITEDVVEFRNQRLASKYLGVSESTLYSWINNKEKNIFLNIITNEYVQIKNKSDISDWKYFKDPVKQFYIENNIKKQVLVFDSINNIVIEYNSAKECSDKLNLLPTTLNWRLKTSGQKVYPDSLLFKYKSDPTPFLEVNKSFNI